MLLRNLYLKYTQQTLPVQWFKRQKLILKKKVSEQNTSLQSQNYCEGRNIRNISVFKFINESYELDLHMGMHNNKILYFVSPSKTKQLTV